MATSKKKSAKKKPVQKKTGARAPRPKPIVRLFVDDPISGVAAQAIVLPLPAPPSGLAYAVKGGTDLTLTPRPRTIASASGHVRWSMARGIEFWHAIAPEHFKKWHRSGPLDVFVNRGRDLNAYYDRDSLSFYNFEFASPKTTIYTGESCDVVLHELGHAVLDSIRPDLWDVMSVEAAAFHESFGDISSILVGLQDDATREMLMSLNLGTIYASTRLSRLAETLGWGLRNLRPDAAPADCLRNAVNAFYYRQPVELPPSGPESALTSEPHSFSRVFTGGAYEALSLMHLTHSPADEGALLRTSLAFARIFVRGIVLARNTPDFFSQVAGGMVTAAMEFGEEAYAGAIRTAFVRRGILSLSSAAALRTGAGVAASIVGAPPTPPARGGGAGAGGGGGGRVGIAARPTMMQMSADELGLIGPGVLIEAPEEDGVRVVRAAALAGHDASPTQSAIAAQQFATQLMRRGRIDTAAPTRPAVEHPKTRKTHEIREGDGGPRLSRRFFDCGFDAIYG